MRAALLRGDRIAERDSAKSLAIWLAKTGRDLREAIDVGVRAVVLGDDPDFRRELAAWAERLGAHTEAADLLMPVASSVGVLAPEAAAILARVGCFYARADQAALAASALDDAMSLAPEDASMAERRAMVAASATIARSDRPLARALYALADRLAIARGGERAVDDLLRAFAADPSFEEVAVVLVDELLRTDDLRRADEVQRLFADAIERVDPERSAAAHGERRRRALEAGDVARALAAALDEGLDKVSNVEVATAMDDLLVRAGLVDLVAMRYELRAESSPSAARADHFEGLARLAQSSLGLPELARFAFVEAFVSDPTRESCLRALEVDAEERGDPATLVEALVRALVSSGPAMSLRGKEPRAAGTRVAARIEVARRLAGWAAGTGANPRLAEWAWRKLLQLEPGDPEASAWLAANEAALEAITRAIDSARADVDRSRGPARTAAAARLVSLLGGSPDTLDEESRLAHEIARSRGDEGSLRASARLARLRGDVEEMAQLAWDDLARATDVRERVEAHRRIVRVARVRGDRTLALETAARLLEESGDDVHAAALAWMTAASEGDALLRARAMAVVATSAPAPVAAVLATKAGETFVAKGHLDEARRVAEVACRATPGDPRALAVLIDAAGDDVTEIVERAIVRAMEVGVPRLSYCVRLSRAASNRGDHDGALVWIKRALALRPGDMESLTILGKILCATGSKGALVDFVSRILSAPVPTEPLAATVAEVVAALGRVDGPASVEAARRILDVFGTKHKVLREAVVALAGHVGNAELIELVLERASSTEPDPRARAELWARLAERRLEVGNRDGAADAIRRAFTLGGVASEFLGLLESVEAAAGSTDGDLDVAAANALAREEVFGPTPALPAWRTYAAFLWDSGSDPIGASDVLHGAAKRGAARGYRVLAEDLTALGGGRYACERLSELMTLESRDAVASGALGAEAARAALATGDALRAMELVLAAVAKNGGYSEVLEVAETAAIRTGREADLSEVYERISAAALGRFGRRASHFRAARFFETRSAWSLALKHGVLAFDAVPSEGSAFLLLGRMAELAGDRQRAALALRDAAARASAGAERARWYLRAAELPGADAEAVANRAEMLRLAVLASPRADVLAMFGDATRARLALWPEDRETIEVEFASLGLALLDATEGPDGARIALTLARYELDLFASAERAMDVLERAFAMDGDVDGYESFVANAPLLATAPLAWDAVNRMMAAAEKPYANTGSQALRLVAAVAAEIGDAVLRARALVVAATREQDDDDLVRDAEIAVVQAGDVDVASFLERSMSLDRRMEALANVAERLSVMGGFKGAIALFERVAQIAPVDLRPRWEEELRRVLAAAGMHDELETRTLRDAMSATLAPDVRARRWAEVASRRESDGDLRSALEAYEEAARNEPHSVERWSDVERVAESCREHHVRIRALRAIREHVDPEGARAVDKRLAVAFEAQGNPRAAEDTWRALYLGSPDDEEADHALEGFIVARGDFKELADHLSRRAERFARDPDSRERLRAVRLRRAAILEQRLGRARDAIDELEGVLADWPENSGALRFLADLYHQAGESAKAARLWVRAAALSIDEVGALELQIRAARAFQDGDTPREGLAILRKAAAASPDEAADAWLELARSLADEAEVGDALDASTASDRLDDTRRSLRLTEAAECAARAGDLPRAADRAARAARLAPERTYARLLAAFYEYRVRGSGTPEEARRTRLELEAIGGELRVDDRALRAFLLAEVLDVTDGGGVGMRVLEDAAVSAPRDALVALGLAERRVSQGAFARALDAFDIALTEDLRGLRPRGVVALAAADAAFRSGDVERARKYWVDATTDPESRERALRRLADVERPVKVPSVPPPEDDPVPASEKELLENAAFAADPAIRNQARGFLAHAALERGAPAEAEKFLWQALADGNVEAGDELLALYAGHGDRTRDAVRVRRQLAILDPASVDRLRELRDAAVADGDLPLSRAVEHVVHVVLGESPGLAPPPLHYQAVEAGLLRLLHRPVLTPAGEVLTLLWEGAGSYFERSPSHYAISGADRVAFGATAPIARLYETALTLLEIPRTALFVKRAPTPLIPTVAHMTPIGVVVTGDPAEDTSDLRFVLGAALSAAATPNVLVRGLPLEEGRLVWTAATSTFGPQPLSSEGAPWARYADAFQRLVSPAGQRRLREIFAQGNIPSFDAVEAAARLAGQRVGFFLSGDLGETIRAIVGTRRPSLAPRRRDPEAFAELVRSLPYVADLHRLALSSEFAAARWQIEAGTLRGMGASLRVRAT
ncbi:MAG: hypothetical protein U0169_26495 [Polyangiaceae bacterium]